MWAGCWYPVRTVQSALIFAIIFVGAVAQSAAIWRCLREGLLARHIAFVGLTTLTLSREVVDLLSRGHPYPYVQFWKATQWPIALLGACAAIEAFWRLALHFRNVRGFGSILLGGITGVAVIAALAVTAINSEWKGWLRGPIIFEECVELGLMLVAMLSLAFFRLVPSIPVRPNSIRHLLILVALFGSQFAGDFVGLVSRGQWRFTANFIITAGIAASYTVWALRMKRAGELLPFAVPPVMTAEEIAALDEWDRQLYAEGNAALGDMDPADESRRRNSAMQSSTTRTGFPILNRAIAAAHRRRRQRRS